MKEIDTLILAGGGVKTISYIGVIRKLEELGKTKNIKTICSVSAGSFIGLFLILGLKSYEMKNVMFKVSFRKLKDFKLANFIQHYGLDSGDHLMNFLENILESKGYSKTITFLELYTKTNIKFDVLATNLTTYTNTIFNYKNTPDLSIISAIRMSMSIPFVFTTRSFKDQIHVDGGLVNNYPINLYSDNLNAVLGLKLMSQGELSTKPVNATIDSFESFIQNVFACYMVQKEKGSEKYKDNTIYIDVSEITGTVNFELSILKRKQLIEIGYNSATNFFDDLNKNEF